MKRHWKYFIYVVRHKWFVCLAGIKIRASLFLTLSHDLSKFRPSEWGPYASTFYTPAGDKQYDETVDFSVAWAKHQNRNPHHWQYWLLTWDKGNSICLPMPKRYVLEMIADWMGAGRAITGQWEAREWYLKNRNNIKLHPATRGRVDYILRVKPEPSHES